MFGMEEDIMFKLLLFSARYNTDYVQFYFCLASLLSYITMRYLHNCLASVELSLEDQRVLNTKTSTPYVSLTQKIIQNYLD